MRNISNISFKLRSFGAADAFARAGAAELDQHTDSLSRAARAVERLVSNDQTFSQDVKGKVEVKTIRYLKALPAKDYEPVTSANVTIVPSEARYIEVKVKPETDNTLFPSNFVFLNALLPGKFQKIPSVSVSVMSEDLSSRA